MTCKDCIHYKVCCQKRLHVVTGMDFVYRYKHKHIEQVCKDYKDRSRFVGLPCKIGDIGYAFYARKSKYNANPKPIIKRGLITEMRFNRNMDLLATVHRVATGIIGKTVFLTPEEAEQALKERKDEH